MNRTQKLTIDWITRSGLESEGCLLEALLRRGFLAFRDEKRVWLGSGSHPEDIKVLQLIPSIVVEAVTDSDEKVASVRLLDNAEASSLDAIREIIAIPEHHSGNNGGGFTTFGPAPYLPHVWGTYRNMKWGAKPPVCPSTKQEEQICGALDTGIALLVKALPLARVATSTSCDGHGMHPGYISFHFPWDTPWSEAVFKALKLRTPNSIWTWGDSRLDIRPVGAFDDSGVLCMLNDIQAFARSLLNQKIIKMIGAARTETLDLFGAIPPSIESFSNQSRLQLMSLL